MASTMTHVVTVVGFVLFINCFNVGYAKSSRVGEYIKNITIKHVPLIINVALRHKIHHVHPLNILLPQHRD